MTNCAVPLALNATYPQPGSWCTHVRTTLPHSPNSSSAAKAFGQIEMPAPEEMSVRCSRTVTSWPDRCNAMAVANPATPAPMTVICTGMTRQ